LQHKLAVRGVDQAHAASVVDELARSGWQSDGRYVQSMVRNRIAQGYGPLRIESELEASGVAGGLIREALATAAADWKALAIGVQAKKFGRIPRTGAEWQKQFQHMAGRGFETEQIYAALKREMPPDE
jgi:regulatory protein